MDTAKPVLRDAGEIVIEDQKDLLNWVLSAAASGLYGELLNRGEVSFAELEASGQADAVAELDTLGFVRLDAGDPVRVLPMPPEVPIVRHYVARASAWLQAAPDAQKIEADLRHMTARSRPRVAVPGIVVPDSVHGPVRELATRTERGLVLNSMLMSARVELVGIQSSHTPAPVEEPDGELVEVAANIEIQPVDLLERGVTMRTLYDHDVLEDADFLAATLEEISAGAQARVTDKLGTDFLVADRACAMLTTSYSPPSAIYTESPQIIWMLLTLFDALWGRAHPVGHRSWDASTTTLTDGHRLVLSLLVNGLNNEAIARTLKVNPRTVRRRIDDLSVAYGVTSRSALIAAAVRQADQ